MKDYLTEQNLAKAAGLGAMVAMMAMPRLIYAERGALQIVPLFLLMTLVAGAATAWGKQGGLAGLFPPRETVFKGLAVAILAAGVMIPLYRGVVDGRLKEVLLAAGNAEQLRLSFPEEATGAWDLILWSAGFETLFFQAATMALLGRLFKRSWVAVAGAVALRVWVSHLQMSKAGIASTDPVLMGAVVAGSVAACLLYARSGFLPASLFSALLSARHLF
jgi:hypothetical protein